ncbi:MAG: acetyl-CoA carboxylase, carboxyltransferase subunit beta [Chthonomonadales bacterium]
MDSVPDGIATKCERCGAILFAREFERNLKVCSACGYHHRLGASERIAITVDEGTFQEMDAGLAAQDPLSFPGYAAKLEQAKAVTGLEDAIVTGTAAIEGKPVVLGVADFRFIGGSMGSVVGEKIARAAEAAVRRRIPLILFSASGGARMQEGLVALMQMAKTSAAIARLEQERIPFISVLTDPTTGGVFASYASLGDVILAEPGATVGFAGRRVGNQDLGQRLPENFQTSEFQLEHGMVDRVVPRRDLRSVLAKLVSFFQEDADGR